MFAALIDALAHVMNIVDDNDKASLERAFYGCL
jgi:hypothetical protein